MQHVVKVWGKSFTIEVHQNSKTVWVAVGEYMGEIREVKGGAANDAISQWKEWARYKGQLAP